MIDTQKLVAYCDQILEADKFSDYCPNGLQVQGRSTISKLVTGVTASKRLIERAIAEKADAILVHHGYFWKNEAAVITGMKQQRLALLLEHQINLIAYHLPLDAHPRWGNNVQLAKVLGFDKPTAKTDLVFSQQFDTPMQAADLEQLLSNQLQRQALWIEADDQREITTVMWCTGAAQSYIEKAHAMGADAFISGEISEATVHFARENNIHYFAGGHHATERYGVRALGQHLANEYALDVAYFDIDNPA